MDKINLDEKFGLFNEHWRPKIIATVNRQDVKIIKAKASLSGTTTTVKTSFQDVEGTISGRVPRSRR